MRFRYPLAFAASALLAAACPGQRQDRRECSDLCGVAAQCGILPSTLGGGPGDDLEALTAACVGRCLASEETDELDDILECFAPREDTSMCGIPACIETLECVREKLPDAVVGAPEVTFKLIDGEFWLLLFQPQICRELKDGDSTIHPDDVAVLCEGDGDPCPPGASGTSPSWRVPLCTGDACDIDGVAPTCDDRMCRVDISPSYDCAFMGIETVQFGYFDERDVLHLDPTLHSCAAASAGQVVPDVPNEVIYPVAMFSGKMTSGMLGSLGASLSGEGRPFCWLSHPSHPLESGWFIRAGSNLIPVPSPGSAKLAAAVRDDPASFPRGCGCLIENFGCEDPEANMNCDNGRDDDRDGLIDTADPGCKP